MTIYAAWQRTIVDSSGNALPGATVEVRIESSGALAVLKADRNGVGGLSNPVTADGNGFARFYVAGGSYKITANSGPLSSEPLRHVAIGLAAESDSAPAPTHVEITAAGPYAVTNERILLVNQSVGAAITLNLPPAADRAGFDLVVIDVKGDAATNNITLDPPGVETINGNATDVIAINKGSKRYVPLAGGSWRISA